MGEMICPTKECKNFDCVHKGSHPKGQPCNFKAEFIHCMSTCNCIPYKEKTMKINDKGGVTLQQILDAQGSFKCSEFDEMIGSMLQFRFNKKDSGLQINFDFRMPYEFMKPWLDEHPVALGWLLDKGLVEEIKEPEKFYHPGQRFIHSGSNEYILARLLADSAALVNVETGLSCAGLHIVSNQSKITRDEMQMLVGGHNFSNFKEVSS